MPRLRDLNRTIHQWLTAADEDVIRHPPTTPKTIEQVERKAKSTPTIELSGSIHSPYKLIKRRAYESLSKDDLERLIHYQQVLAQLIAASSPTASSSTQIFSLIPQPHMESPLHSDPNMPRFNAPNKANNALIQRLQEFIRMDKGLPPLAEKPMKPKTNFTRLIPRIPPRLNRTQWLRIQFIRKAAKTKKGEDQSAEPGTTQSLSASKSRLKEIPIKFNKLFELRYRHNEGNPIMPSALENYVWNYKRLPFKTVGKVRLPPRYLMPTLPENAASYYGIITDEHDPFSESQIRLAEEHRLNTASNYEKRQLPAREQARPPLRKSKYRPQKQVPIKSRRKPWDYGAYARLHKISMK